MRWDPYLLFKASQVDEMFREHFTEESKVLFVLGKGFDVRMNNSLKLFKANQEKIELDIILIDIEEETSSSSHLYGKLSKENFAEFGSSTKADNVIVKSVKIWEDEGINKRRVGDKNAADIFKNLSDLEKYDNIIVDISSLPRGIYFSLIGKLLSLIDNDDSCAINLMVAVSENARIDSSTNHKDPEEDLKYSFGFSGGIELQGQMEKPLVWFPILGEKMGPQINKCFNKIKENGNSLYEICPVLPFPSKDPRRSDNIIMEYHSMLFDNFSIEAQNIMYTSEQNPFDTYFKLSKAIGGYQKTLSILGGCKVAISSFGSKLFSIGIILTAHENKEDVGILNVSSKGYSFDEPDVLREMNEASEVFVTWLTGKPYKKR